MVTLKDIANKLNVSITTVSRVLNNDTSLSVSEKLRKRIIDVAYKMEYKTPRNRKKNILSNKLNIAIVHCYDFKDENEDPFYSKIRRGIEQLSITEGIIPTFIYKNDGEYEIDSIKNVRGIICVGKFSRNDISLFESITKNIVFIHSSPNEIAFDSVVVDYNTAVRDLLKTLIDKGYKSIGYIGGVENVSYSIKLGDKKELVFRDFLYQKGILNTKYIHIGNFTSESGYELMKLALNQNKRAEVYFCANDVIAIGALRAIYEKGLNIPEDIGIIGFNNDLSSSYTFPPLSTVHLDNEFIGREALKSLLEIINGRSVSIKKVIPTKIIIRESIK